MEKVDKCRKMLGERGDEGVEPGDPGELGGREVIFWASDFLVSLKKDYPWDRGKN